MYIFVLVVDFVVCFFAVFDVVLVYGLEWLSMKIAVVVFGIFAVVFWDAWYEVIEIRR